MTVAIGMIAESGDALVWSVDTRISLGHVSADLPFTKGGFVHKDWLFLFSGDDITHADPYVRAIFNAVDQATPLGEVEIMRLCCDTYREQTEQFAERKWLGVYGLKMAEFRKEGRQMFGDFGFADLRQKIENTTLGCDFLVMGFDQPHRTARLFTVSSPGRLGGPQRAASG